MADFLPRGCRSVGQPDERDMIQPKVGVDESDSFIEANTRVRGIKLPRRVLWIADGDPAAANEIDVVGESFDFGSLEIKRILRNQDQGIGMAFDSYGALNVRKSAVPGAYVVMSLIGFEVFIVVIEPDMSAGDGFGSLFVVFDVICLEALASIMYIYVLVGNKKVATFLLRAARPDLYVAGFA